MVGDGGRALLGGGGAVGRFRLRGAQVLLGLEHVEGELGGGCVGAWGWRGSDGVGSAEGTKAVPMVRVHIGHGLYTTRLWVTVCWANAWLVHVMHTRFGIRGSVGVMAIRGCLGAGHTVGFWRGGTKVAWGGADGRF